VTNRIGRTGFWWGFLLIAGGGLWLGDTAGLDISPVAFVAVFGLAGTGFAVEFARDAGTWWAAMVAGPLLGLAALIAVVEYASAPGPWGAAILLAGSALGFAAVYVRARDHSWVLAPAGLLVGVSVIVAAVPVVQPREGIPAVVLGIIAVALAAAGLVPIQGRRLIWPLIPAGVVVVVAWFIARGETRALEPFNWISAAAIIVLGLVVVAGAYTRRDAGHRRDGSPPEGVYD